MMRSCGRWCGCCRRWWWWDKLYYRRRRIGWKKLFNHHSPIIMKTTVTTFSSDVNTLIQVIEDVVCSRWIWTDPQMMMWFRRMMRMMLRGVMETQVMMMSDRRMTIWIMKSKGTIWTVWMITINDYRSSSSTTIRIIGKIIIDIIIIQINITLIDGNSLLLNLHKSYYDSRDHLCESNENNDFRNCFKGCCLWSIWFPKEILIFNKAGCHIDWDQETDG